MYNKSTIAKELSKVRNVKPLWSKFGTLVGVALGGIDMWLRDLGINIPFTMSHKKPDHLTLQKKSASKKIEYPKPDGVYSFDRLSSVYLSSTNHEEDLPVHLNVGDLVCKPLVNITITADHQQITVLLVYMNGYSKVRVLNFRSTLKIVYTVKLVISKTQIKI